MRTDGTMIGGRDIVLSGPTRPDEAERIIRTLRPIWPNLVVQDATADEPYDHDELERAGPQLREFLVYRDTSAFSSWAEHGATPDNTDALLHVILEPNAITLVVREGESNTQHLANQVVSVLCDRRETDASVPEDFGVFKRVL